MNELTFEKSMNALHGCDAVTISLKGVGEESYSTREVAEAIYEELEKVANAPRKNPRNILQYYISHYRHYNAASGQRMDLSAGASRP